MRRKIILRIILAFLLVVVALVGRVILNQWRRMTTMDSMGQIWVAMCETVDTNNFKQIDIARESLRLFPEIPVKNDHVMDGWGRPLTVSIAKTDDGFQLNMISLGPDGVMGTSDDIIWKRTVRDDHPTPKGP